MECPSPNTIHTETNVLARVCLCASIAFAFLLLVIAFLPNRESHKSIGFLALALLLCFLGLLFGSAIQILRKPKVKGKGLLLSATLIVFFSLAFYLFSNLTGESF